MESKILMPLNIEGLVYTVNSKRLIDNLQLYITSSGITVILGSNGAGKSLLLRLIHGLLKADSGSIKWGKQKINRIVRHFQSLVFQKPVLLRRSTQANVEFVLKLRGISNRSKHCDELLDKVGLRGSAKQAARSLSGGEQQRLALVRSLATDPSILMLDELSSNLDPVSIELIENILIQENQNGVKVFLVTHDLNQAQRLAEDIVFMHRGRVIENTLSDIFFNRPKRNISQAYLSGKIIL